MKRYRIPKRNYAKEWKEFRKLRGWTQTQLAEVLDLDIMTVSHTENGRVPKLQTREKMAALKKRYAEAEKEIPCPQ